MQRDELCADPHTFLHPCDRLTCKEKGKGSQHPPVTSPQRCFGAIWAPSLQKASSKLTLTHLLLTHLCLQDVQAVVWKSLGCWRGAEQATGALLGSAPDPCR